MRAVAGNAPRFICSTIEQHRPVRTAATGSNAVFSRIGGNGQRIRRFCHLLSVGRRSAVRHKDCRVVVASQHDGADITPCFAVVVQTLVPALDALTFKQQPIAMANRNIDQTLRNNRRFHVNHLSPAQGRSCWRYAALAGTTFAETIRLRRMYAQHAFSDPVKIILLVCTCHFFRECCALLISLTCYLLSVHVF